jgi:hypothetical protein
MLRDAEALERGDYVPRHRADKQRLRQHAQALRDAVRGKT